MSDLLITMCCSTDCFILCFVPCWEGGRCGLIIFMTPCFLAYCIGTNHKINYNVSANSKFVKFQLCF